MRLAFPGMQAARQQPPAMLLFVDLQACQDASSIQHVLFPGFLFPAFFQKAKCARSLFELVPIIHRQWPSAASMKNFQEKVAVIQSTPESLTLEYSSPNRLCTLLKVVAQEVLDYYDEKGSVTEIECVNAGSKSCKVKISFEPDAASFGVV